MKKLFFIAALFFLVILFTLGRLTYNKKEADRIVSPKKPDIVKNDTILNPFIESSPFVWKGELKYLVVERTLKPGSKVNLAIYDFATNSKMVEFGDGFALASAYVEDNVLYVFATKDWSKYGKAAIYLTTTKDLENFTKPLIVYKAPNNEKLYNSSVTKNGENGYVLAFDVVSPGITPFSVSFLTSKNLYSWERVPYIFGKDRYVGASTIKWQNGYYYLFHIVETKNYINCQGCKAYKIKISRTKDLYYWEESQEDLLNPDRYDEGINNSDVDLISFNGTTHIFYAIGDQATWGGIKVATFSGDIIEMLDEFTWAFSESSLSATVSGLGK